MTVPSAVIFTEQAFLQIGLESARYDNWDQCQNNTNTGRFKKQYGVTARTCADLWSMLRSQPVGDVCRLEIDAKPIHLLVACRWLFTYDSEDRIGSFFGIKSQKTIAKWVRHYVCKIASLLPKKTGTLDENNKGLVFLMTIDGTHCPIWEPRPWSKDNSSHKFGKKPGVNYELGISLYEPKLIWLYGPTQPGKLTDLMVFQESLKFKLPAGTKVIGDGIFSAVSERDYISTKNDLDPRSLRQFKNRALARHETFNQRIKCFEVLTKPYRHNRRIAGDPAIPHGVAFRSVCVLVMFQIENFSTRLFDAFP